MVREEEGGQEAVVVSGPEEQQHLLHVSLQQEDDAQGDAERPLRSTSNYFTRLQN